MNNKYSIKLFLVILGVDKKNSRRYVLSTNSTDVILPTMDLETKDLENLNHSLIQYVRNFVFTNELELTPQLINLHSTTIDIIPDQLNTVYGFVIDKIDQINNSHWIELSYTLPNKYSLIIFETIQNLR